MASHERIFNLLVSTRLGIKKWSSNPISWMELKLVSTLDTRDACKRSPTDEHTCNKTYARDQITQATCSPQPTFLGTNCYRLHDIPQSIL